MSYLWGQKNRGDAVFGDGVREGLFGQRELPPSPDAGILMAAPCCPPCAQAKRPLPVRTLHWEGVTANRGWGLPSPPQGASLRQVSAGAPAYRRWCGGLGQVEATGTVRPDRRGSPGGSHGGSRTLLPARRREAEEGGVLPRDQRGQWLPGGHWGLAWPRRTPIGVGCRVGGYVGKGRGRGDRMEGRDGTCGDRMGAGDT